MSAVVPLRAVNRSGRVDAPQQLLEPRFEDRALRVGVRSELVEPAADVLLELSDSAVEARHPLVALPLERFRRIGELALQPLRARVADVREAFREHDLGLACECLDGAVELARESARGILAARLDERGKLLRPFVRIRRGRALNRARELLDL